MSLYFSELDQNVVFYFPVGSNSRFCCTKLTSALKILTVKRGPILEENMKQGNIQGAGRATRQKEPGPGQLGLAAGSLLRTSRLPLDCYIRKK